MSIAKCLGLWSAAVIAAVMLSGVSSAPTEMSEPLESNQISREEIQELLRNVESLFGEFNNSVAFDPNGCSCSGLSCKCCQRIHVKEIGLNENCCIAVAYLKAKIGIKITLTIGSHTIVNKEISAQNPPPICAGIPVFKKGASVCLQFYNLKIDGKSFSGCSRLLFRLLHIKIATFNTGCFRINFLDLPSEHGSDLEQINVNDYKSFETIELPYFEEDSAVQMKDMEQPLGAESNQISMEEIRELLRNVELLFEESRDSVAFDPNGCKCDGVNCSCCRRVRVQKIGLDENCCVAVAFLKEKTGLIVTVTIGRHKVYSKEIPVREPPKICVDIPFVKKGASVCLEFYNLKVDGKSFSGCVKLLFRLLDVKVATVQVGCFKTNFLDLPNANGSDLDKPEVNDYKSFEAIELPYFEEDRVVQMNKLK